MLARAPGALIVKLACTRGTDHGVRPQKMRGWIFFPQALTAPAQVPISGLLLTPALAARPSPALVEPEDVIHVTGAATTLPARLDVGVVVGHRVPLTATANGLGPGHLLGLLGLVQAHDLQNLGQVHRSGRYARQRDGCFPLDVGGWEVNASVFDRLVEHPDGALAPAAATHAARASSHSRRSISSASSTRSRSNPLTISRWSLPSC